MILCRMKFQLVVFCVVVPEQLPSFWKFWFNKFLKDLLFSFLCLWKWTFDNFSLFLTPLNSFLTVCNFYFSFRMPRHLCTNDFALARQSTYKINLFVSSLIFSVDELNLRVAEKIWHSFNSWLLLSDPWYSLLYFWSSDLILTTTIVIVLLSSLLKHIIMSYAFIKMRKLILTILLLLSTGQN